MKTLLLITRQMRFSLTSPPLYDILIWEISLFIPLILGPSLQYGNINWIMYQSQTFAIFTNSFQSIIITIYCHRDLYLLFNAG